MAEQRTATFDIVQQELQEGTIQPTEENLYRRIYVSITATDRAKTTLYISLMRKVPQRVSLAPRGGGKEAASSSSAGLIGCGV